MSERKAALKYAFPYTIPVLTGFAFLGTAYGILMSSKGISFLWTMLMSFTVFSGSIQYMAATLLVSAFNPLYALGLTIVVNARYLFYGIAMLEKLKDAGKYKPYIIFGMCDETFSILCSIPAPPEINKQLYMLYVTLLDHSYWILGSALGCLIGSFIPFNSKGLDFVLTALFVVIFINQWKSCKKHTPAIVGVCCSIACLVIFGPDGFIIPAMASILLVLALLKEKISKELE